MNQSQFQSRKIVCFWTFFLLWHNIFAMRHQKRVMWCERCIYLTTIITVTHTIMWENIITVHRFLKTYVSLLGSHLIGENDFFPDFLLLVDITVPMVFPDFNLSLLVDRVDLIFSNSSSEPSRASSSTSSSKS